MAKKKKTLAAPSITKDAWGNSINEKGFYTEMVKFSPEHEKLIAKLLTKWDNIAFGKTNAAPITEADRERMRRSVVWLYTKNGQKPPQRIHFFDSPHAAIAWARENGAPDTTSTDNGGAGYWAGWAMYYDFCKQAGVASAQNNAEVDGFIEMMSSGIWDTIIFDTDCLIILTPTEIHFDDQNRLHNAIGPAIKFRDGSEVYVWENTAIPREWIMEKDSVDPQLAFTLENMEDRRILIECLGWDRILKNLPTKVLDADPDPMIGTLMEVTFPDKTTQRFVKVLCGTGREFTLLTSNEKSTALEANAETQGIPPEVLRMCELRT